MPKKRLLRCRACRLAWFPQGGAAAACPACGGEEVGATLELFHVGIMLMALALIGWMWPLIGQGAIGEVRNAAIPAVFNSKQLTAEVKQEDRRVLVKDRRGTQVYVSSKKVSSKKVKRRQKAKTRSQHVQR